MILWYEIVELKYKHLIKFLKFQDGLETFQGLIKFFLESKSFPTMRTTVKVERVVSPRLGSWEHGISVKISSENDE